MSFIEVRNKKGTSNHNTPYGYTSWLDFWEKKQGKKASSCEVLHCNGKAEVGGHVYKVRESSKEYILPMCYDCNNKPDGETFKAWESDLVPVN